MRASILGLLVVFGMLLLAAPANAQDWRRLNWQCHHGDRHACHVIRLHRACDHGDRRACRQLRW